MLKRLAVGLLTPSQRRWLKRVLGRWQPDEVELVYDLVKDDQTIPRVMIDVGAHHGGSLEWFARDGWQVFAFEPDPANRALLRKRCHRSWNLAIDERAVSDRDQAGMPLYSSDVSSGISGLSAFHDSHRATTTVDTITLTRFCSESGIPDVGVLKIDTEGHDLFVLKGVDWARAAPAIVVCEFEDRKTRPLGYGYHDVAKFLGNNGYHILVSEWYPIVEYGARHRWRRFARYPCELASDEGWGNLVATRCPDRFDMLLAVARETARHAGQKLDATGICPG